ncbi:MAG: alpha/beta hydrolase domain-containing protein, partial [Dehalococcoidia bacterium]
PAADVHDLQATLSVSDRPDGERTVIPRDRWRFAHDDNGHAVTDDTHIRLDGGFTPGLFYEVVYRTRTCPVVGTGLLAVRDFVSFLRYAAAPENPCAERIDYAFGFGTSQSGRFLRNYLYLGLNKDERGRMVFDGVLPHVAGARRGEFNHRFAQPSVQYTASFGHRPPFTDDDQTDAVTGVTDGLLRRQRQRGSVPRIIYANSAAEYWRGDCSLLHTDLAGERDIEPPDEVRVYHLAGAQHGPGVLPLGRVSAIDGSRGLHAFNAVNYSPLMRAALINLERWVTVGEAPPPSAFPRLADGTAARPEEVLAFFETIPGATPALPSHLRTIRPVDLGPDAGKGVGRFPAGTGEIYPTYRAAVDEDGNERGGIRLPDLTVPVATSMGWNPRDPAIGGAGQIINMLGSTLPFPARQADRERTGDPRRSIEERYRDRDDYEARVRAAAERLAADRYILAEDIPLVVANCLARYDAFAAQPAAVGGDG